MTHGQRRARVDGKPAYIVKYRTQTINVRAKVDSLPRRQPRFYATTVDYRADRGVNHDSRSGEVLFRDATAACWDRWSVVRVGIVGYTRVNAEEQTHSGAGLEGRERALRVEVELWGWDLQVLSNAGKSGTQINPRLRHAVELPASGQADELVVTKMDRLARSLAHAVDFIALVREQDWSLVVSDMGADLTIPRGRVIVKTMVAFAWFQREFIYGRIEDAMAARKHAGAHPGRPHLATTVNLADDAVLSPPGRRTSQAPSVRRLLNFTTE